MINTPQRPTDPLLTGLASMVGAGGQEFARQNDLQDQATRQGALMDKQMQFRKDEMGQQENFQKQMMDQRRYQQLEDSALAQWLQLANGFGYSAAKTPEDQQTIASQTDAAFAKIPVMGKLLPMVQARINKEAAAPKTLTPMGQTNFGEGLNNYMTNDITTLPLRALGQTWNYMTAPSGTPFNWRKVAGNPIASFTGQKPQAMGLGGITLPPPPTTQGLGRPGTMLPPPPMTKRQRPSRLQLPPLPQ